AGRRARRRASSTRACTARTGSRAWRNRRRRSAQRRWRMCTEASRHSGQALVETLVAALVLVLCALLVVLLGKYQSMQMSTIAASRTLAFECTVRPHDCGDASARERLGGETTRRHFGRIDREILSNDVLTDAAPPSERNALW